MSQLPAKPEYIKTLKPHHKAMARLIAAGMKPGEVAEHMNFSIAWVSTVTNTSLFKEEVKRLQAGLEMTMNDTAAEDLLSLQNRAIEVIASELYKKDASVQRTRTAFNVLDRTGLHPKRSDDNKDQNITIIYNAPKPGDDPNEHIQKFESIENIGDENGNN